MDTDQNSEISLRAQRAHAVWFDKRAETKQEFHIFDMEAIQWQAGKRSGSASAHSAWLHARLSLSSYARESETNLKNCGPSTMRIDTSSEQRPVFLQCERYVHGICTVKISERCVGQNDLGPDEKENSSDTAENTKVQREKGCSWPADITPKATRAACVALSCVLARLTTTVLKTSERDNMSDLETYLESFSASTNVDWLESIVQDEKVWVVHNLEIVQPMLT